jgi:hypothetical protein
MDELMNYKVRFHLAKGEHFMHWQVRGPNGYLQFYDPKQFALKMYNCVLKNQRATAQKICDGENSVRVDILRASSCVSDALGRISANTVSRANQLQPKNCSTLEK